MTLLSEHIFFSVGPFFNGRDKDGSIDMLFTVMALIRAVWVWFEGFEIELEISMKESRLKYLVDDGKEIIYYIIPSLYTLSFHEDVPDSSIDYCAILGKTIHCAIRS